MDKDADLRIYRGISGDRRRTERRAQIVAAGLELLGRPGGDELTVRGVRQLTGLSTRYFYENFPDRDALAFAVYCSVVDEVARAAALAVDSVAEAGAHRVRAGVAAITGVIRDDPRMGRILFEPRPDNAPEQLAQSGRMDLFVRLFTQRLPDGSAGDAAGRRAAIGQFAVGGFGRVLTAWLTDRLTLDEEELVDICTALLANTAMLA